MDLKAKLVEKTSKTGNKYIVIEIPISSTYSITFFPSKEQLELIKVYFSK